MAIKVEVVKPDIEKAVATSNCYGISGVENEGGVLNVYYEILRGNNGLRNANTTVNCICKILRT